MSPASTPRRRCKHPRTGDAEVASPPTAVGRIQRARHVRDQLSATKQNIPRALQKQIKQLGSDVLDGQEDDGTLGVLVQIVGLLCEPCRGTDTAYTLVGELLLNLLEVSPSDLCVLTQTGALSVLTIGIKSLYKQSRTARTMQIGLLERMCLLYVCIEKATTRRLTEAQAVATLRSHLPASSLFGGWPLTSQLEKIVADAFQEMRPADS